ncbi:hypothetical protein [Parasitella parasitica]|uniref:MULE transposase domain-containing protein n=1 Tax=Parasitella parasitica TaxID=35722 RepID=A0A0B7MRK3_9FUNG|nr:hypothetical protein [Parasitella parasitica]
MALIKIFNRYVQHETVQNSNTKHGVKCINPYYVGDNPKLPEKKINEEINTRGRNSAATTEDPNNDGAKTSRKCRERTVFVNYVLHVTGSSVAPRNLQKPSKITGCKATLKVACYKNGSDSFEVLHNGTHNHKVRGAEDLKHLSIFQARKDQIMEQLWENSLETNCNSQRSPTNQLVHRDRIVHQEEVYNILKKIQELFYRKSVDEMESVILWLNELIQNILRHPVSGTGFTVAYVSTKDCSMAAAAVFLRFVKHEIGVASLDKITVDVSETEHAAIPAVYSAATIQWCLFHVSLAWMGKLRELVKLRSTDLNHHGHREIITDLKALM